MFLFSIQKRSFYFKKERLQKLLFQIENISTKQDLEKEIGKVVENTVKSSIIFGSENKDYGVFPGLPNHKHLENNQICSSGNIY